MEIATIRIIIPNPPQPSLGNFFYFLKFLIFKKKYIEKKWIIFLLLNSNAPAMLKKKIFLEMGIGDYMGIGVSMNSTPQGESPGPLLHFILIIIFLFSFFILFSKSAKFKCAAQYNKISDFRNKISNFN